MPLLFSNSTCISLQLECINLPMLQVFSNKNLMEISMTKYQQTANPNATNSELDAKKIVYPSIPNCELPVSLTEEQISTILYIMEGYIVNSDDTNDEQFNKDVDDIFEKLETAVDIHEAELDALTNINPEPFIPTFHD